MRSERRTGSRWTRLGAGALGLASMALGLAAAQCTTVKVVEASSDATSGGSGGAGTSWGAGASTGASGGGGACAAGTFVWARDATISGEAAYYTVSDVARDPQGNVYATGTFHGTVTFGSITVEALSTAATDAFVAKMDQQGNWLWVKHFGSPDSIHDAGQRIGADDAGNVYVLGRHAGPPQKPIDLGGLMLAGSAAGSAFLLKMNGAGQVLWAKMTNGGGEHLDALHVDGAGNVRVGGSFAAHLTLDGLELSGCDAIFGNPVVLALDAAGAILWAQAGACQGANGALVSNIASDGTRTTIVGIVSGPVDLDGHTLDTAGALVASLDENGHVLWARVLPHDEAFPTYAHGVAMDGSGNAYVSGSVVGPTAFDGFVLDPEGIQSAYVGKLDPAGKLVWVRSSSGMASGASLTALAWDGEQALYAAGRRYGAASFGDIAFDDHAGVMILKLDLDGHGVWGAGNDCGSSCSPSYLATRRGVPGVVMCGQYTDTATFGSTTLSATADNQGFVAELCK